MNRILLKISFVALIFALGCSTLREGKQTMGPSPNSQPSTSPQGVTVPDIAVSDLFRQIPFIEKEKSAGLLRAWKTAPNYNHYRKAKASDFVTASWNEKEFDRSYDYGEIAGAYGLALFVIDKTVSKPEQFSLVVFIERPNNRYNVYWIYRDENLSGLNLSRSSGDIFLRGVGGNGMSTDCEIKWSRDSKKWTCE
jgi:hypothetical protein